MHATLPDVQNWNQKHQRSRGSFEILGEERACSATHDCWREDWAHEERGGCHPLALPTGNLPGGIQWTNGYRH